MNSLSCLACQKGAGGHVRRILRGGPRDRRGRSLAGPRRSFLGRKLSGAGVLPCLPGVPRGPSAPPLPPPCIVAASALPGQAGSPFFFAAVLLLC